MGSVEDAIGARAEPSLRVAPRPCGVHDGASNISRPASPDALMPIDPQVILDKAPHEEREVLTPQRAMLYALGVGADELEFVYERGLQTLPTLATVLAPPPVGWYVEDTGVLMSRSVHAEISLVLHAPVPTEGEVIGINRMLAVVDKGEGKGALLYSRRDLTLASGEPIASMVNANFLRGQGGFGGERTSAFSSNAVPDRPHDREESRPTAANQAMIYRLSGDFNPLHIDPRAAERVGYERPILHGLATLGVVGRTLLAALMDNRPERMRRLDARFTAPVYPGETITTRIWLEGPGRAAFRAMVCARDAMVLDCGLVEWN